MLQILPHVRSCAVLEIALTEKVINPGRVASLISLSII